MKGIWTRLEGWLVGVGRSGRPSRSPARVAARTLLHAEPLEDRDLPSVLGVPPHHAPAHASHPGHAARVSHAETGPARHPSTTAGPARATGLADHPAAPEHFRAAVREALKDPGPSHGVEQPVIDAVARAVAGSHAAPRSATGKAGSHSGKRAASAGLQFNQAEFLKLYQSSRYGFGERLSRRQQAGIRQLLTQIGKDGAVRDVRWVAYMLATVKHEAANTWQPIEEFGCNPRTGCTPIPGNSRSYGNPDPVTHKTYYGRGYVQITYKSNYAKMNDILRRVYHMHVDLVHHPEQVLDPTVAYRILSYGMRYGTFTGRKLGDFIRPGRRADYYDAREIVNGLDRAATIAGYAQTLEGILRRSLVR